MPPATFYYEKNESFEKLAAGSGAIFESRTRFLIFAASVGFSHDHWVEDNKENGEMRWNYIAQNQRLSVITAALAYARTEEDNAILDPELQIDVLTSYGAGGARIIQREVVDKPGSNLDNLITFLQEQQNFEESQDRIGVLEQIENEVSSFSSSE